MVITKQDAWFVYFILYANYINIRLIASPLNFMVSNSLLNEGFSMDVISVATGTHKCMLEHIFSGNVF